VNDLFLECVFWLLVGASGLFLIVGAGLVVTHIVASRRERAEAELERAYFRGRRDERRDNEREAL
jgi:hypothetical protein